MFMSDDLINHLHSDNPVFKQEEDHFQRYGFAKRIADMIKQRKSDEGLVIQF